VVVSKLRTVPICLGPYSGLRGEAVSHERGTPVGAGDDRAGGRSEPGGLAREHCPPLRWGQGADLISQNLFIN
jgi:hypothetical protein